MSNKDMGSDGYDKTMILDLVQTLGTLSDEELEPIADGIMEALKRIKGIKANKKKP